MLIFFLRLLFELFTQNLYCVNMWLQFEHHTSETKIISKSAISWRKLQKVSWTLVEKFWFGHKLLTFCLPNQTKLNSRTFTSSYHVWLYDNIEIWIWTVGSNVGSVGLLVICSWPRFISSKPFFQSGLNQPCLRTESSLAFHYSTYWTSCPKLSHLRTTSLHFYMAKPCQLLSTTKHRFLCTKIIFKYC